MTILRNYMKNVLLTIIATMLMFGSAYAQPSFTIGLGMNQGVFAAEGKETNNDEGGSVQSTTTEYGAFKDSYPSLYLEVGNDQASIGIALQNDLDTPQNINERGAGPSNDSNPTSKVSGSFEDVITVYGLVNMPYNLYAKAGIVMGDIISNETQKSGNSYGNADLDGYVIGFGYQHEADQANIRFEILGHSYDDVSFNNNVAASGNRNVIDISDMIGASAQISINKTF